MYHYGDPMYWDSMIRLRNKLTIDDEIDENQIYVRGELVEVESQSRTSSSSSSSSSLSEILILVFPLLLIYISNQWSRYSISYLVDFSSTTDDGATAASAYQAMNIDLQFTQSQYGLLASTAFTVLFALSSLLAGSCADRYNRKLLTLVPATIWTLATLYTSFAQTYNDVLIARVIMGGACAFAVPAAYSLLADNVSKDKLALTNSLFGSGVYLGGALASLSLLLDQSVGWRGTMTTIGGFGAVSVVMVGLLLPSDDDRDSKKIESSEATKSITLLEEEEKNGVVQNAIRILSIPRVRLIFIASFFRFCSGLMIGVWAASYYKQAFPDYASEYAVVNALIVGVLGFSSGILGGYIADGLGSWYKATDEHETTASTTLIHNYFDEQTIRLVLPIFGSLLAIPAWFLTTHTTSFEMSMAFLGVEYLVGKIYFCGRYQCSLSSL
jgi:MFS family permease